jgi:hypothetical protein
MLEDKWRDDEKWFLNDFSEWDSSFINAMSGMTKQLCLWMGAPPFFDGMVYSIPHALEDRFSY